MNHELDAFSAWARSEGTRRHQRMSRRASASPAHQEQMFQVLYNATMMVAFAELRVVFEVAVKEYNDGCGFPDLRIGYSDIKPKVIQVERRHAPRVTLTIDADKPRGTTLVVRYSTPDADLFRTPPPDEVFIPLTIDSNHTRVVLERSPDDEAQRTLKPVLAV